MAIPKLRFLKRRARFKGELALFPDEPWAEEKFHLSYKEGENLNIAITKASRIGKNGMYWGGLGLFIENTENKLFPTTRRIHEALLAELNMMHPRYKLDGTFVQDEPDSIAFDNMSDDDFAIFTEKAAALMVKHFGYNPWEAWVEQMEARKNR